jgi:hypothetical protein
MELIDAADSDFAPKESRHKAKLRASRRGLLDGAPPAVRESRYH